MYLIFCIVLIVVFITFIICHYRKKKICKKICAMQIKEKECLLNEVIEPFGYCYEPKQDVFSTTVDAWQRSFGYSEFYSKHSHYINIIFDSDLDDWKRYTSVFNDKIKGKKNLSFLIEDEEGNMFGYYLNSEVENSNNYKQWIETDNKSFHFNLNINKTLEKPMKHRVTNVRDYSTRQNVIRYAT